jgi:ABC-type metal ion transport system substrate-binding protein
VELDAAQLPRSLDDLDAAAINGNYAESAGLSPTATRSPWKARRVRTPT